MKYIILFIIGVILYLILNNYNAFRVGVLKVGGGNGGGGGGGGGGEGSSSK